MKSLIAHMITACVIICTALMPGCAPLINNLEAENAASEMDKAGLNAAGETPSQPYVYMPNPHEGSLWTPYNSRSFMFGDNKARGINDIVTIKIMEASDASRNATTELSRKSDMSSGITKFFGSPDLTFGMDNLWGKNTKAKTAAGRVEQPFQPELETATENSYNGEGSTVRKDKFLATISAKVCEVYPNGNMLIKGNREVSINNEKQYIYLSGIIRPEDISFDNVVVSTAIADAKISISGKGVIADKQSPGYGHKVFDYIWPF